MLGMAKKIDHTQESKYSFLVGKTFITKTDLVLLQQSDSKQITVDKFGGPETPKREEMKNKFPYRFYASKILGVLPSGSVFKVVKVTEEGTLRFVYYYATLIKSTNNEFVGKNIHVTSLTNVLKDPAVFEPELVSEVTADSSSPQ
jgi:hypothetical protein